jgi:hypothetical protein
MPATAPTRERQPAYLWPPLIHDHASLFKEPTYPDGQPYTEEDDDTEPDV